VADKGFLEVQGVVAARNGEPIVQFIYRDMHGVEIARWQQSPDDARDHAQLVHEAAANAVYEASLISWAVMEGGPGLDKEQAAVMLGELRDHRKDKWGVKPPEDWREKPEGWNRAERAPGLGDIHGE
jgi:hypothetical protein